MEGVSSESISHSFVLGFFRLDDSSSSKFYVCVPKCRPFADMASTSEECYAVNAVDLSGVSAVTFFLLNVLDQLIPLNKEKNTGLR